MESKTLFLMALGIWLQSLTTTRGWVAADDSKFCVYTPLHLQTSLCGHFHKLQGWEGGN